MGGARDGTAFFVNSTPERSLAPESPGGDGLRLDWVRDMQGLESLKPYWDCLLEQSATRTPFLRWDWVSAWWRHFGKGRELAVAVLRGADEVPAAIAPLMISCGEGGLRRFLRWVTWIGGLGPVTGERMDFLVPAGREPELAPRLCRAFVELAEHGSADAVWLPMVPEESPNLLHVQAILRESWPGAGIAERLESRCLRLPSDWGEIETGAAGRWRRKMRRRNETFTQRFQGQYIQTELELAPGTAMDELARLHAMHWPLGVSHFLRPESWSFHRELGQLWLGSGRAMMPALTTPEGRVAMLYGFVERKEFFFYQHGWEERLSRLSPGNLVLNWSMDLACQKGLRLYDMLPGDQAYKAEWCRDVRVLLHLEATHPKRVKGRLFRWLKRRWLTPHCRRESSPPRPCIRRPRR